MIPTYLYHYTSLETLLLILEENTIRFSRLDLMNDPVEGHNDIWPECRENVFSSSWTAEARDELPMWKLYSDLKGVRIRMPIDLFNFSDKLEASKREGLFLIKSKLSKPAIIERYNFDKINNVGPMKFKDSESVYGPTAVTYHENKEAISEGMVVPEDYGEDRYQINLTLIGGRKLDYWSFEKEYRYRIIYGDALRIYGNLGYLKQFSEGNGIIQRHLDVEFKQESLEGVEIILGPHSNSSDRNKIVEILRSKNITSFSVLKSKLEIKPILN